MIIDTLSLLNETALRCLNETDEKKIIATFTRLAVDILGASFGFVWMSKNGRTFELAYRSRHLPYTPFPPRKGGRNSKAFKSSQLNFVPTIEKRKDRYDVSQYMASFVIIPIAYQKNIYGTITVCFKRPEKFSKETRIVCALIGNGIAQVMTILRTRKELAWISSELSVLVSKDTRAQRKTKTKRT